MHWVMFFLIQQEDREDERQQGLRYKLKSLWIHHIDMIMRAMCDQSKFNYLSGGLLAPRSFLILLSKDWKLLIVPLLYQGDVFRNMQAASCFQRVRTGKAIDHSILHKQRNPPQQPQYVHNRTVAHRQLPGATRVAQGTLTGIPVPYLHDTFLSP